MFDMGDSEPGDTPVATEGSYPPPTDGTLAEEQPNPGEEKDHDQAEDSWWEIGVYIGTAHLCFQSHYIFLASFNNEQRRSLEDGVHSAIFATPTIRNYNPHFTVGAPYWFKTALLVLTFAPDDAKVHAITGDARDVNIFHPTAEYPPPVLRCTLLGTHDKFLRCKATETHRLVLDSDPVISVFRDRQLVTSGGDFLIRLRAFMSGNTTFPHAVQPGGITATLFLGKVLTPPTVDTPPRSLSAVSAR